jgi:hypothetical protein
MIVTVGVRHEAWLWLWYLIGAMLYVVKRAFYQMQPPNVVANNITQYVKRAGIPILERFALESAFFWVCFNPVLIDKLFSALGWESYLWMISFITQFAPAALVTGMAMDPMFDWIIPTVFSKIPVIKDIWAQMPGPLPQQAIVEAQIVQQTTQVTQLQTTTTTVPAPESTEGKP